MGFHCELIHERGHVTVCKSSAGVSGPGAVGLSLADINNAFDFVWLLFAHITICGIICPSSSGKAFHICAESDESIDKQLKVHGVKSPMQLCTTCPCDHRQLSAFLNFSFLSANGGKI